MWEMMDPDLECGTECGGPGPPPEFLVPPPPRPPFLAELLNCNEEQQQQQQQQQQLPFGVATGGSSSSSSFADVDMCEAFPILDASYHSGPSFQTSAMIVLCSVLLLLVIFISSLLVWKHKRKVQNFLPCKTPTRGGPHHPHLDAAGVHSGAHSVTYEDPDVHLGHHPLVMRHHHHHHNMELHAKQIHYPSGYPMPRSPPLFICSSPGPDPYRSHDNVYEELEHGHLHHHHHHHPHHLQQQQQQSVGGRDTDSEPPIQSDDDFAEDELSLPGDRSFHKSPSDATTVATIYHDRSNGGGSSNSAVTTASAATVPASDLGGGVLERNRTERNSLLSSSSSSNANDNPIPLPPRGGNGSNGGGGPSPPGGGGGTGTGGSLGNNNNNNGSNSSSASNSNRNSNSSADCASGHSGNGNGSSGGSNNNNNTGSGKNAGGGQADQGALLAGGLGGLFRSHRKQHHHPSATLGSGRSRGRRGGGQHPLPAATAPAPIPAPDTDPIGLPPLYDERGMMTLPPPAYHHPLHHPVSGGHHHQHHLMNSLNNNSASSANSGGRSNYYSTIDDDELLDPVERRNRINAQLSAGPAAVSTIFRHRGPAPSPPLPPHHHQHHHHNNNGPLRLGSRTNPRNGAGGGGSGMLRNGVIAEPNPAQYIYHEPVSFHEGLIYDGCLSYSDRSGGSGSTGGSTGTAGGHPYILPQFSTFRSGSGSGGGGAVMISGAPGSGAAAIYSRDSSFGSDSGYSQHTQASNRSGGGCWQGHRPHRPAPPSGGPSVKHGGGSGGATEPTLQPVVRPPSPVSGVGGS
ncbi:hornerin [Anopheles bellator]|uniref:hornerin n=1 Tax=Anopheles bellator TaxID=139047 RepID=UPI0026481FE0|nr:hornerin [Anopheles bellator]